MSLDHDVAPQVGGAPPPPGRAPHRRRGRTGQLLALGACLTALVLVGVVALSLAGGVRRSVDVVKQDPSLVYSNKAMLAALWSSYKATSLEQGTGRTMDPQSGGATTSEGESYTMMRAVWMDDQATFARSWQWTKDNLQRRDHLMSWRFGQRPDGSYGVQDQIGGQNAASDADSDIAYALLMGYSRWKQDSYLYDALPVLTSIWTEEVVQVAGAPVLTANDLERHNPASVLVNPSYFAPYAYRAFAKVDPAHDWTALVDSSYRVLDQLGGQPLGASSTVGLPPDWVQLDRATGAASAPASSGHTTDYGYEALRLPWRLALDLRWNHEPRARALLGSIAVLGDDWGTTGRIVATYHRDGSAAADYESTAMYGGALGALSAVRPQQAREVYRTKLLPLYDPNTQAPAHQIGYYDANWMWFGMALYLGELPDLNGGRGGEAP